MTSVRGRLLSGGLDHGEVVVETASGRVTAIRPPGPADDADSSGPLIVPGLVDIHCHGGGGASFNTEDPEEIDRAAQVHLRAGTTCLIASVVTDTPARMLGAVAALAQVIEAGAVQDGAGTLAGIHLEGPFLSADRCGAQNPDDLLAPDPVLTRELIAAARGHLRQMTLAPELPGADLVAAALREAGVVPAVGHTAASAPVAAAALRGPGPGLVTHLFNGMAPVHHRDPGAALAALAAAADGAAVVELIADGVHLHDDTVSEVWSIAGPDSIALVTDAMAAAGMPDGDYTLGPQTVQVRDGVARLARNDSIAGGTSLLSENLGRLVRRGLPATEVVAAATSTPARVLGLDGGHGGHGRVEVGRRADLVVLDADWRPTAVMRAGRWVR